MTIPVLEGAPKPTHIPAPVIAPAKTKAPSQKSAPPKQKTPAQTSASNVPDSKVLAKSTLTADDSTQLTNVYTIKQDEVGGIENIRNRTWIHDLLDDNKIPYYLEVQGHRPTKRIYVESQLIFVERKNGIRASFIINEYLDTNN